MNDKCVGCDRAFARGGAGARAQLAPNLCKDCTVKEISYHPQHAPGVKCLDAYLEGAR